MQNMKQKIYHISIFLLFWFCGAAYPRNPKTDILQQDLSGLFGNSSMIPRLAITRKSTTIKIL